MPAKKTKLKNSEKKSPSGPKRNGTKPEKKTIAGQTSPPLLTPYPEKEWLRRFRRVLLNWYSKNQRDLPWRKSNDPYSIWVSEIMLQQTQVATVIEYFNRFMKSFPDIQTLADASEKKVLAHWEGLGYYRRARHLHAAAKKIVAEHGGQFPTDFETVFGLPGIGRYTAGAILSIALDKRLPILEGNTFRVYSRLLALNKDPRDKESEKLLWQFASDLLPAKRVGEVNQALMELGSEICKPKSPLCNECPVAKLCAARQLSLQSELPLASKKIKYESRKDMLIAIQTGKQFLVRKIPLGEWWSGLFDFVRINLDDVDEGNPMTVFESFAKNELGLNSPPMLKFVSERQHAVTKYRIHLKCYQLQLSNDQGRKLRSNLKKTEHQYQLLTLEEIDELPLNKTARELWQSLAKSK